LFLTSHEPGVFIQHAEVSALAGSRRSSRCSCLLKFIPTCQFSVRLPLPCSASSKGPRSPHANARLWAVVLIQVVAAYAMICPTCSGTAVTSCGRYPVLPATEPLQPAIGLRCLELAHQSRETVPQEELRPDSALDAAAVTVPRDSVRPVTSLNEETGWQGALRSCRSYESCACACIMKKCRICVSVYRPEHAATGRR
jgi:hypothetical protein